MPVITTALYGDLALLTLQGAAPMRESLGWRTEVQIARDGTEQRLRLRERPRQSFNVTFPASSVGRMNSAFNLLYGQQGARWGVPVWSEVQPYVGASGSTIPCDTTARDLRATSLALLWKDPDTVAVVQIASITSTTVVLSAAIPAGFTGSGYILPLRKGRLLSPTPRRTTGYSAKLDLNFEVDDNLLITPSAPPQYLGEDIYFDQIFMPGDELEEEHLAEVERVDDELGAVEAFNLWTNNRFRRPRYTIMTTPAEVWAYRQWLHRRAGRYRAYWEPSFLNDIRHHSTGTVTTTLVAYPDDRLAGATARTHIAVEDTSGNWLVRQITAVTPVDENNINLTLSSSLGIAASTIRRISYLGLRRLDTDRVELNWSNGVVTSNVATVELTP